MRINISPLLVILGLLAGVAGLATMSQATMGVGFIGFGCLLAILARIAQAGYQFHNKPTTPPQPGGGNASDWLKQG